MRRVVIIWLVLALLITCADASVEQRWSYEPMDWITEVYAGDIDNDGGIEVLVSTDSGVFYTLTYDGEFKWTYDIKEGVSKSKKISDFYFSGGIVALGGDNLYCLKSIGIEEWRVDVKGYVNAVFVEDLEGDGGKEIIAGSSNNRIYVLDSEGEMKWDYLVDEPVKTLYAGDIDGDGSVEIIAGSEVYDGNERKHLGKVYVLDREGKLKWSYEVPVRTSWVSDLDGDGLDEVIIGSAEHDIYVLDNAGNLRWRFETEKVVATVYVSDLDGDNFKEVVVGSFPFLYAIDKDGKELWRKKFSSSIYAVFVTDLENDGIKDIIVGSNIYAFIFDSRGNMKEKWRPAGGGAEVKSIWAADLYKNGIKEIILGYNYQSIATGRVEKRSRVKAFERVPEHEEEVTTIEEDANLLYENAEESYILKDYDKVKDYAGKARKIYLETGDKSKALGCDVLILKAQADQSYSHAEDYFISMDYVNAVKSADEAKSDYLEFQKKFGDYRALDVYETWKGLSPRRKKVYVEFEDVDWIAKADSLLDKSEKYLKAYGYYQKALEYYRNKDYENASKYALMAKNIYKILEDDDMISKTEGLITYPSAEAPETPVGKVTDIGGGFSPNLSLLLLAVMVLGILGIMILGIIFVAYKKMGSKKE